VGDWNIYLTSEVAAWLENLQATDAKTAGLADDAIYATMIIAGMAQRSPQDSRPGRRRDLRAEPHGTRSRPTARRHHHRLED